MSFRTILIFLFLICPLTAFAEENLAQPFPLVVMETSMGTFKIELFDKEAPLSTENFRDYVRQGFYDGLIFHRVIPRFMAQGGGFESGMKRRNPTRQAVPNEATNGKKNKRGTLAMARTRNIHSATSQFFVNVVDNISLDNRGTLPHEFGYAVFGRIAEGMDVVDKIVNTPTTMAGQYRNVPKKEVLIIKAYEEK